MNKEKIYLVLKSKFATKDLDTLMKVTADVFYSGEPESVLADDATVDKLFKRWEAKKGLSRAEGRVAAESSDFCPICKMATTAIYLDKDRAAKWCSRHFVVFPSKVEV